MKLSTGLFALSTAAGALAGYSFHRAEDSYAAAAQITKQLDSPKAKPEVLLPQAQAQGAETTKHFLETVGAAIATVALGIAASVRRSKEDAPATGLRFKNETVSTEAEEQREAAQAGASSDPEPSI